MLENGGLNVQPDPILCSMQACRVEDLLIAARLARR